MTKAEETFLQQLGSRIAERRRELGLTQTELGEAFNVSQQTIAQYESAARRMPITYIPKLLVLLDIDLYELLGLEPNSPKAVAKKKPGPPPKIQKRIESLLELPRAQQKTVLSMLDGLLKNAS